MTLELQPLLFAQVSSFREPAINFYPFVSTFTCALMQDSALSRDCKFSGEFSGKIKESAFRLEIIAYCNLPFSSKFPEQTNMLKGGMQYPKKYPIYLYASDRNTR